MNVSPAGSGLSNLCWIESPMRYHRASATNQMVCNVSYSALNFRDVMLASGKLPADAIPGKDIAVGLRLSEFKIFMRFLYYM